MNNDRLNSHDQATRDMHKRDTHNPAVPDAAFYNADMLTVQSANENNKKNNEKTAAKRLPLTGQITAKGLARAAVIAALYVALTLTFGLISFGPTQARISEVLTVLPLFFGFAIPALAIGCMIANIFGGIGVFDIVLGPLASLVAAILTYIIGRAIKNDILRVGLGILPPIIINAFAVPLIFILSGMEVVYIVSVALVGLGQTIVLCGLGIPLYIVVKNLRPRLNILR